MANIDREVVGAKAVVEIKTANAFSLSEWGESGSDVFPDQYQLQLRHYMEVLGYEEGYLAALIGGQTYRWYHIERDQELAEIMIEGCVKFWERVEKGIPPEIDFNHSTTADLLKRRYPGTNGETIYLPESIEPWLEVRKQAEARIKEDTAVVEAAKNRITAAMGDAAVAITPDHTFQYKRSLVKKKEFVSPATEYYVTRGSKYTPPKGE